ncbi:hypothetical protein [Parathalassolituus penaei]|uniref:DUF2232 domain-containing protein n=1 Tax=Parathalassolituus penaei TaxID=2997323 RepID=A0A9X3EIF9_9GAMM|nr:hypothetical protein [Parathalassolituus penaei]MCY0964876.1 hypothetical protein [Parathalassolituus penaei]
MVALAQWAMGSRNRATLVAALLLAIPILFWLGAAIIALVILRQGFREAFPVALWASLPAIGWVAAGDPTPLVMVIGTSLLAVILRSSVRLELAVMAVLVPGIFLYWLFPALMPELLPKVIEATRQSVSAALAEQPVFLAELLPYVDAVVVGGLAAIHSVMMVLCLILARHWQARLYNPGGFAAEFRMLRLPSAYALPALLLVFSAGELQPELAGMVPILTVPLVLAGIAMVHGVVHLTVASPGWLLPVYVGLFVFGPYMYTLLIFVAALDSILNIRARLKDTAGTDD